MAADMIDGQGKCTKRSALIARKSAKFLSSPAGIVRFIVKIVTQKEKIAAVNK